MNVLLVAPEWPPNTVGGGGIVYQQLANTYATFGHSVTVVHGNYMNRRLAAPISETNADGLTIVSVPLLPTPRNLPFLRTSLPPLPSAVYGLRRFLKHNWDVAHLHGVGAALIDYSASMLQRARIPYVFTIHGFPATPFERGPIVSSLYKAVFARSTLKTIMRAAAVTGVSNAVFRSPLFPDVGHSVIYNGLSADAYDDTTDHGEPSPCARLVSLSRLSLAKGLDVSVKAVKQLVVAGHAIKYDIYGADGGFQSRLAALINSLGLQGIVRLMGPVDPTQRSAIFKESDVCLMPSRDEPFGLVALESLAAGLPLVASRAGGLGEFLSDSAAVLVPPDDPDALAQGIIQALRPTERASLIERGRSLARSYTWDVVGRKYESLLLAAANVNVSRATHGNPCNG